MSNSLLDSTPVNNNDTLTDNQHQPLSSINKEFKKEGNYLAIKNISKYYDDLKAVNCFNGDIFPNEIFCLLGHNGAGKTTLIKIISGNEVANCGNIILYDVSLFSDKKKLI